MDSNRELKAELHDEVWCKGGRGSTKSTFISIQILLGLLKDSEANAVVTRRYQNELRDTVYGQFEWTISKMGLGDYFKFQVAPMQIIYIPTGQKIVFKAADNPLKMKSINLGRGYIKYAWFEEVDQFAGMEEIRNILQSLFRGENKKRIVFFFYNPPKSGRSWVNQEAKIPKPGRRVHHSTYLDVPPEWLGERFLADAEHLKKTNETAYRHEYSAKKSVPALRYLTMLSCGLLHRMKLLHLTASGRGWTSDMQWILSALSGCITIGHGGGFICLPRLADLIYSTGSFGRRRKDTMMW